MVLWTAYIFIGRNILKTTMIICAKGFSSRLHEKNLRPFCGKPLVYWPILQGMCARLVDEVIVSTQDRRIAEVAEDLGAEVFWRQYKDTDETSGTIPVVELRTHLIKMDRLHSEDIVVLAWAPNCILKPEDIDRLVTTLQHYHRESKGQCENMGLGAEEKTISCRWKVGPNRMTSVSGMNCINTDVSIGGAYSSGLGSIVISKGIVSASYASMWMCPKPPSKGGGVGYYMEVEPWQMQDMDRMEELEFGEIVFEHYILKGRGDEVYKEYAKNRIL